MSLLRPSKSSRGILVGVLSGLVGIGCCVGPAVAALTGITSAAIAIDLANGWYERWAWAFRTAGAATAAAAIFVARASVDRCRASRSGVWKYTAVVAGTGVATYAAFYGITTWLGAVAS